LPLKKCDPFSLLVFGQKFSLLVDFEVIFYSLMIARQWLVYTLLTFRWQSCNFHLSGWLYYTLEVIIACSKAIKYINLYEFDALLFSCDAGWCVGVR